LLSLLLLLLIISIITYYYYLLLLLISIIIITITIIIFLFFFFLFLNKKKRINLAVWDTGDDAVTTNVFYDDYMPIAEARTYMNPYGYQFTSDIELESVTPNRNGIYPSGTTSVTISFSVKNNGPQQAGDITINFTPPLGSSFRSSTGPSATTTVVQQAAAPFQNNSFYKLRFGNTVLQVGQSLQGSITFNILANHPKDMQFKLSATCSSIEKLFQNNYFIQQIYIEE